MLRIEPRRIKKYQLADLTFSVLNDFYANIDKRNDIILVYSGDILKTLLAYEDFEKIKSEKQLECFLKTRNNCYIGCDKYSAKEILTRFPQWKYLLKDFNDVQGTFFLMKPDTSKVDDIFEILKKRGANVYRINIPFIGRINNTKCYGRGIQHGLWRYIEFIIDGEMPIPQYIDKITDIEITKETKMCSAHGKVFGNGKRKIYIVGPCIAGGITNPETESLPEILSEEIARSEIEYSVLPVRQSIHEEKESPAILEYNINKNDIVIFINSNLENNEFDTTSLYNSYEGGEMVISRAISYSHNSYR